MRYAISGGLAAAIDEASGAGAHLLGKAITSGRVLWLKSAWFYNTGAELKVSLEDATSSATHKPTTGKMTLACASGRTTMIDIPSPGIKFINSCRVIADASLAATGVIGIGDGGGCGYEE